MKNDSTQQSLPGQIMILFAVALISLVGIIALAVDTGFLLAERRQNQAAVDAAALAAGKAMLDREPFAFIVESGEEYGSNNSDVPTSAVDVDPDISGGTVRVTITKDIRKFFLGAIYGGSWTVTNTALARIEPVPKPYALVALSPCPAAGIKLNGSVHITIDGGGSILSNCNITNTASGGGSSLVLVGGSIDAAGPTIQSNPSWIAPDGMNSGMTPADDPLASATPPNPSALGLENRDTPTCLGDAVCYMDPGIYTTSFTVRNTVCMRPGIYYFTGSATLSFQNNNSLLTNRPASCPGMPSSPPGVMIYVTGNASIDMKNNKVILSTIYPMPTGQSECNPAAAPYPGAPCGMVLWIANGSAFASQAGAVTLFEGVFYAPQSTVTLQGSPGTDSQGVQVIVGVLELGGSGVFNLKYTEYVKLDSPRVFLVE